MKLCMKIRYEILGTSGYIRKEEKVTQFFRRRGLLVFIAHLWRSVSITFHLFSRCQSIVSAVCITWALTQKSQRQIKQRPLFSLKNDLIALIYITGYLEYRTQDYFKFTNIYTNDLCASMYIFLIWWTPLMKKMYLRKFIRYLCIGEKNCPPTSNSDHRALDN